MASPPPNPKEGEEGSEFTEEPRERPPAPQKTLIAPPASQLPTKLQYVTLGASGPSGIKQLFRTVKVARRVPTLPRRPPRDEPSTAAGPPPAPEPPPRPPPARRQDHTKRHICETCEKRFSSPGKLTQHVLSHTGELPFSCDLCDKRFNSKFKLVRHNLIHSESRAFACNVCGKTFNRKDHLTNHVRVHNPVKKLYTCDRTDCRKSYTSLLSYRKHAALHSAEEGNLTCKICEKTFTTRQDIVYHLKVHTGSRTVKNDSDKKYTCSFCDRKFFTAKDVRRHQVVHTGRRDFLCPYCPQKFGRKDHLVRHVKNAHPDESWKSAAVGTSSDPTPEALAFEETYTEYSIEGSDLSVWNPQSPDEGTSERGRTRVPSSDIIVEMPSDLDIKVEPMDIKLEDQINIKLESPGSPGCSLIQGGVEYPLMYVVAPPYSQTPSTLPYMAEDLPDPLETHLLHAGDVETLIIDPGEGPSGLSSEMLRGLLDDSEPSYTSEEGRVQQRLPAFTQAFQTAQSPKPPPPPPPPH